MGFWFSCKALSGASCTGFLYPNGCRAVSEGEQFKSVQLTPADFSPGRPYHIPSYSVDPARRLDFTALSPRFHERMFVRGGYGMELGIPSTHWK